MMPFEKLTQILSSAFGAPADSDPDREARAVKTATAAILLEIAYADDAISLAEEGNLTTWLQKTFSISDDEVPLLIEEAETLRSGAIDHYQVTNTVRRNTTFEQRLEIVRMMWRIVYADGHLHQYENHLVRKLADLLGVEHKAMIDVKMEVRKELRLEN